MRDELQLADRELFQPARPAGVVAAAGGAGRAQLGDAEAGERKVQAGQRAQRPERLQRAQARQRAVQRHFAQRRGPRRRRERGERAGRPGQPAADVKREAGERREARRRERLALLLWAPATHPEPQRRERGQPLGGARGVGVTDAAGGELLEGGRVARLEQRAQHGRRQRLLGAEVADVQPPQRRQRARRQRACQAG